MDQSLIHSTYQSAINLKDVVKLSVAQCREARAEGTVPLGELAFSALAFSSNKASSPSNPNMKKKIVQHVQLVNINCLLISVVLYFQTKMLQSGLN